MPATEHATLRSCATVMPSPIGDILLTSDGQALTGLFMAPHDDQLLHEAAASDRDAVLDAAVEQLGEYFAGRRQTFDVELRAAGTPFQQQVWAALSEIPYGDTISYAELARRVGSPNAFRAVGQANGRNPISVIVPCHRVIGADGKLAGYGGGTDRKRFLLALEEPKRPLF